MLWFPLAMWAAFSTALEAAVLKRHFSHLNSWEAAAIPFLWGTPFFLTATILTGIPDLRPGFWPTLALLSPLVMIAFRCQIKGIMLSPISLTMPFLTITPGIVVITGYLVLGETVTLAGLAGIAAIMVGGYVINLSSQTRHWLDPIRAIATEPGTRYMLVAASIFGLCTVLGKRLLLLSSPLFAASAFWISTALLLVALPWATGRLRMGNLVSKPVPALLTGVLGFTELVCHMSSISMVAAAYMISVKRLTGLFSVLIGWQWLKEGNIPARLTGAAFMAGGAVILALMA